MPRRPFQRKLRVGKKKCWVVPVYGEGGILRLLKLTDVEWFRHPDQLLFALERYVEQEIGVKVRVKMHKNYFANCEAEDDRFFIQPGKANRIFSGHYPVSIIEAAGNTSTVQP